MATHGLFNLFCWWPFCDQIHVYPMDHVKAIAAVTASHSVKPAEGTLSRKERRKGTYSNKRIAAAAISVATVVAPARP